MDSLCLSDLFCCFSVMQFTAVTSVQPGSACVLFLWQKLGCSALRLGCERSVVSLCTLKIQGALRAAGKAEISSVRCTGFCLALGWQQSSKLWCSESLSLVPLGWRQDGAIPKEGFAAALSDIWIQFLGKPKQRLLPGRDCRESRQRGEGVLSFWGFFYSE